MPSAICAVKTGSISRPSSGRAISERTPCTTSIKGPGARACLRRLRGSGKKSGALPVVTSSYDGRRFDGTRIVQPYRMSDGREGLIDFASVSKVSGGWRLRFRGEHDAREEEDALLMLTAALAWRKVRDRSPDRRK